MSIVNKPNTFSGNTTISSSEVNSNFDTLYNEFNGSISAANLADDAVTAAKLADNAVVAANISSDSVTATKIDWASTGADGGIWWEELGRTTLASDGDTISVTGLEARKYIRIIVNTTGTGLISQILRFNNDTGNNYAYRYAANDSADTGLGSQSSLFFSAGDSAPVCSAVIDIVNMSNKEKRVQGSLMLASTGAASIPARIQMVGKWVNTSDSITRIDWINTNTGDFAIGSEVVVLGHN